MVQALDNGSIALELESTSRPFTEPGTRMRLEVNAPLGAGTAVAI